MASGEGITSGVADPETLYTKQNCIGMLLRVCFELEAMLTLHRGGELWKSLQRVGVSPSRLHRKIGL